MSSDPFSLEQKRVLITGASSGIGREAAIQCARRGASVIATGRNEERLNKTLSLLEGSDHEIIMADLTVDSNKIADIIPPINGIVHSAGIMSLTPFMHITGEMMQKMMQVNFYSPVILTQALLKHKKLNSNSSIVFVSSLAGNIIASKGNSAYSASKAALSGIARVMALELASRHIRVNCLLPGMVKTELINSFLESLTPEQLAEDEKKYPLGYGSPVDVANAAMYLLSDASSWITGQSIILDGGFSIQ